MKDRDAQRKPNIALRSALSKTVTLGADMGTLNVLVFGAYFIPDSTQVGSTYSLTLMEYLPSCSYHANILGVGGFTQRVNIIVLAKLLSTHLESVEKRDL